MHCRKLKNYELIKRNKSLIIYHIMKSAIAYLALSCFLFNNKNGYLAFSFHFIFYQILEFECLRSNPIKITKEFYDFLSIKSSTCFLICKVEVMTAFTHTSHPMQKSLIKNNEIRRGGAHLHPSAWEIEAGGPGIKGHVHYISSSKSS